MAAPVRHCHAWPHGAAIYASVAPATLRAESVAERVPHCRQISRQHKAKTDTPRIIYNVLVLTHTVFHPGDQCIQISHDVIICGSF